MTKKITKLLLPVTAVTLLLAGCSGDKNEPKTAVDKHIYSMAKSRLEQLNDNPQTKKINETITKPFKEISLNCTKETLTKFDDPYKAKLEKIMMKMLNGEKLTMEDKDLATKYTFVLQKCIDSGLHKYHKYQ